MPRTNFGMTREKAQEARKIISFLDGFADEVTITHRGKSIHTTADVLVTAMVKAIDNGALLPKT